MEYLGTPNLSTSIDHQSGFILSNEIVQKFISIHHLNEIYEKVRSNDKNFTDKIHYLLTDIAQENEKNSSLTLQSQVLLARNLAHTLNNNEQIKKK